MKLNRRTLYILSLFTLFGFGFIGLFLIYFFQDKGPKEFFLEKSPLNIQIFYGLMFGTVAVFSAILLVRSPWMRKTRNFFADLIKQVDPGLGHILFYSFCAAVGEEILFRGAAQPYLGIWLTSFLFIFMHGYLNPYNWQITIYGIFMVIISSGFGYLFKLSGIFAAISAHFVFDVAMFLFLVKMANKELPEELAVDTENDWVEDEDEDNTL